MIGIYLLKQNNSVVYVGKSSNDVYNRIKTHYKDEEKKFDSVSIYQIKNKSDISIAEIILITNLKPKYNKDCIFDSEPTISIDVVKKIIFNEIHHSDLSIFEDKPKSVKEKKIIINKEKNDQLALFD